MYALVRTAGVFCRLSPGSVVESGGQQKHLISGIISDLSKLARDLQARQNWEKMELDRLI